MVRKVLRIINKTEHRYAFYLRLCNAIYLVLPANSIGCSSLKNGYPKIKFFGVSTGTNPIGSNSPIVVTNTWCGAGFAT